MDPRARGKAQSFHGCSDAEIARIPRGGARPAKYHIIQERELSYGFYLHQHPYVQQLMLRLLQNGTAGLQAADTDYEQKGKTLPGSIEVALAAGAPLRILDGSRIGLNDTVKAQSEAGPIELAAGMELKTDGAAHAKSSDGLKAVLLEGMDGTPAPDSQDELKTDAQAIVLGGTKIALQESISVILPGGSPATLPQGTHVFLADGTQIILLENTSVTFLKSKPRPKLFAEFFSNYAPNAALIRWPSPVSELAFTPTAAYAVYNWELFFHVPLTIAVHLSKNQRFAGAQQWFHYIFDPTDDSGGPTPERFWKVRPFQYTDVKKMEEILVNLVTGEDEALRNDTIRSIEAWQEAPFRPHVIARYRQQAYMYKTVMAYLDNLIAWGDSLFRQDTGEAIDEALQLYVMAANILGPRPQPVPKKGSVRPQTYANLRQDLREFGTAMREVEEDLPFDRTPFPAEGGGNNDRVAMVRSLGKALYFCVPPNDKLLGYWDTVADRLFKIRNSLNIQGVFRQLALYEPPIDPALLARAVAAGLDIGAIVSGINQPLPLVRFQVLVQKAAEIAQEVKSLGNSLLLAVEKEDNEALAILRAKHERAILEMVEHVKYGQLQEAIKAREGLLKTLALAVQRYTFYEKQLGKTSDDIAQAIPEIGELDQDGLDKMNFAMDELEVRSREIEVDIAQDLGASGGKIVSSYERQEIEKLAQAQRNHARAALFDMLAGAFATIPTFGTQFQPFGTGGTMSFGGSNLSAHVSLESSFEKTDADRKAYQAGTTAKTGSYARREQDWAFQSNLAAGEIDQIFKQLRAAQIREAVARKEWEAHRKQMEHADEIERFLNEEGREKTGKKTNKAFYLWMKGEVKGLYSQCFQFAFDIAKKAERALQHELGDKQLSYLKYSYLAGREGLLAGEKLYLDIKRMEMAYHDLNQREYELTKHISLLQVDPLALLQLRTTGRCTVRLPEALFDMDGPGHYFRRIKTVAVSIPCVAGPYASVNCTLTLLKSSIRKTQVLKNGVYARENTEDDRFEDYFGSLQSVVTSSGQNDSGLFETNLRDERYLPFENAGVISEWQLELPANPAEDEPRQFDYDTIADVILHTRYIAREGGALLKSAAKEHTESLIKEAQAAGSVRLFSVRHEFPTDWAKLKGQTAMPFELALNLRPEHYPFWSRERLKSVSRVDVFAMSRDSGPPKMAIGLESAGNQGNFTLTGDSAFGKLLHSSLDLNLPACGEWKISADTNAISELWIAVAWGDKDG